MDHQEETAAVRRARQMASRRSLFPSGVPHHRHAAAAVAPAEKEL